jgi:(p)ppGpp synthase/HD superfamily hydrolase
MIKHGRKQKLKTAAEEDLLYAKHWYSYLRNGKAVRKIKKQLNRRYRKEMEEEGKLDLQEEFAYIDDHFNNISKEDLIKDLIDCGLQEKKCN